MTAHIDPNLIVLLFLFGFSLLYAFVLIIDAISERAPVDRHPERSPRQP